MIPQKALDYLKRKNLYPAFSYEDVWLQEHAYNFTVAKAMQLDVLQDIKDGLEEAIANGKTLREFKKDLTPLLMEKGWWGKRKMKDPLDGKKKKVQLGSDRRLNTIYNVNKRQAYLAAQWQSGQASKAHTHILYMVGSSTRHRRQHLEWNALVLPKEHGFWTTHFPMNGWGCKCRVRFLTKADLEHLREKGMPDRTNIVNGSPQGRMKIKETSPAMQKKTYINKRKGTSYEGYAGIDPGFEWNPGTSRGKVLSQSLVKHVEEYEQSFPSLPAKGTPVARAFSKISPKYADPTYHVLNAINQVHGDGTLPKLPLKASRSKKWNGVYDPKRGGNIRIAGGPHVELTIAHEIGHFLDHRGLPGSSMWSNNSESPLIQALKNSPQAIKLKEILPLKSQAYYLDNAELFARAYAQYIAFKSKDPKLLLQVKNIQLNSGIKWFSLTQWAMEDFLPIQAEFDKLFRSMGWL